MKQATSSAVQTGSPEWLVQYLSERRARLETVMSAWLEAKTANFYFLCAGLLAFLVIWLAGVYGHWFTDREIWTEARFLIAFPAFTFCTVTAISLARLLPERFATAIVALAQIGGIALTGLLFAASPSEVLELVGLVLLLIASAFAIYRLQEIKRWNTNTIFFVSFLIACALTNIHVILPREHSHQFMKIFESFRWLLVITIPVFSIVVSSGPAERRQFRNYILFPVIFLYPLPSRLRFWDRKPDARVASRGFLDVSTGLIYLIFCGILTSPSFPDQSGHGFTGFLSDGFFNYIYIYFRSAAIITIPVGLGRIFGFHLPDPYEFPLLATTPQERWRRWNTYFYQFFMISTFHPVYKYTRSVFLAVFCVFFFTAATHDAVSRIFALTPRHPGPGSFATEVLAFFFLHACFVYLGLKTERFWPTMKSRKGWYGVLLTTFLMSLIHFFKLHS